VADCSSADHLFCTAVDQQVLETSKPEQADRLQVKPTRPPGTAAPAFCACLSPWPPPYPRPHQTQRSHLLLTRPAAAGSLQDTEDHRQGHERCRMHCHWPVPVSASIDNVNQAVVITIDGQGVAASCTGLAGDDDHLYTSSFTHCAMYHTPVVVVSPCLSPHSPANDASRAASLAVTSATRLATSCSSSLSAALRSTSSSSNPRPPAFLE
jgi:hypothetical protein